MYLYSVIRKEVAPSLIASCKSAAFCTIYNSRHRVKACPVHQKEFRAAGQSSESHLILASLLFLKKVLTAILSAKALVSSADLDGGHTVP